MCVRFYDVRINLNFPYIQSCSGQFHTVDFSLSCRYLYFKWWGLIGWLRTSLRDGRLSFWGRAKMWIVVPKLKKVDIDKQLDKIYWMLILGEALSKHGWYHVRQTLLEFLQLIVYWRISQGLEEWRGSKDERRVLPNEGKHFWCCFSYLLTKGIQRWPH